MRLFKEFGLVAGLLCGIDRVLDRGDTGVRLIFYEFLAQPVPDQPVVPPRFAGAFDIREMDPADPLLDGIPPPRSIVDSRFRQNAICLGAFRADEFIAYQWHCIGPYEEDEVRCTFIPYPTGQSAFDFDIYVFPDKRLGAAFAAMWDGTNKYLRERGVRHTFSRVSRFNNASRAAHARLGAKRIGRAIFLSSRHLQLTVSTVPPFLHFAGRRSRGPQFVLRAGR